ncbi:hypothetical protein C8Q76DRAFT_707948 [Earliella scabrosa]|nr:hypothetical protein C8Q76DRAFT_707948 [Earliella scabrosa]
MSATFAPLLSLSLCSGFVSVCCELYVHVSPSPRVAVLFNLCSASREACVRNMLAPPPPSHVLAVFHVLRAAPSVGLAGVTYCITSLF